MLLRVAFIFISSGFLASCFAGHSEDVTSYDCLKGDKEVVPLTVSEKKIGEASIAKACIEEPLYSGGADLKFCSLNMTVCGKGNKNEDMFFMNFSFREKEWAIRKIKFIKERYVLKRTGGNYGVYQHEKAGDVIKYIPRSGEVYSVECWVEFGTCEMEGAHGEAEYKIETSGTFGSVDWAKLHKNVGQFISESVSLY